MQHDQYTAKAREALDAAHTLAAERGHAQVEPEHVLLALLQQTDGAVPQVVARLGLSLPMVQQVEAALGRLAVTNPEEPAIGPRLTAVLQNAENEARRTGESYVSTDHLLVALSENRDATAAILRSLSFVKDRLQQVVTGLRNVQFPPPVPVPMVHLPPWSAMDAI